MPKGLGAGKRVTNRWRQDGAEGRALIECFTEDGFDINNHDVNDVHAYKTEFQKFEISQLKSAIKRLQQNLSNTGSIEGAGV